MIDLTLPVDSSDEFSPFVSSAKSSADNYVAFREGIHAGAMLATASPPFAQRLLDSPESFMRLGVSLPCGSNRTAMRVDTADGPVVIKKYRDVGLWGTLKRSVTPSRAASVFRNTVRLLDGGVRTPRPIAFVNRCPLRPFNSTKSYYVYRWLEGDVLDTVFRNDTVSREL